MRKGLRRNLRSPGLPCTSSARLRRRSPAVCPVPPAPSRCPATLPRPEGAKPHQTWGNPAQTARARGARGQLLQPDRSARVVGGEEQPRRWHHPYAAGGTLPPGQLALTQILANSTSKTRILDDLTLLLQVKRIFCVVKCNHVVAPRTSPPHTSPRGRVHSRTW